MGNKNTRLFEGEGVRFLEKIGEGSYAKVYRATWKGEVVAAKHLMRHMFYQEEVYERFLDECDTLRGLNHPNIVKMIDLVVPSGDVPPILITELLSCDLQTYIKNSTPPESSGMIPLQDVVNIMSDVAEGLQYLHARPLPIAHRDLASKNVLLTESKRAKIADLGLAKVFEHETIASPVPGTRLYAAPETFPSEVASSGVYLNPAYDVKVDVFSFGVLMLEVINGHPPRPDPLISPFTRGKANIFEHIRHVVSTIYPQKWGMNPQMNDINVTSEFTRR